MRNLGAMNRNADPRTGGVTLADRVKSLARPVGLAGNGSSSLAGEEAGTLLASLLHEIDETVLPRRFRVATDTGRSVTLHVAGRKLIAIRADGSGSGGGGGGGGLSGNPAVGSGADVIAALGTVFSGATRATLQITRSGEPVRGPVTGHSVRALALAAGIPLQPRPDPDPVPGLFRDLAGGLAAWVQLDRDGNIVGRKGDASRVRPLEVLAREHLAEIDSQMTLSLPDPKQPGSLVLSSRDFGAMALVYARSPLAGFLALLPVGAIPGLQQAWLRFYSRNSQDAGTC